MRGCETWNLVQNEFQRYGSAIAAWNIFYAVWFGCYKSKDVTILTKSKGTNFKLNMNIVEKLKYLLKMF